MKKTDSANNMSPSLEEKIFIISDEFINILKHLSMKSKQLLSIKLIAERMFVRDNVKQMLITHNDNCSRYQESVFERADRALYLAKNSGRNTVKSEKDVASQEQNSDNTEIKDLLKEFLINADNIL